MKKLVAAAGVVLLSLGLSSCASHCGGDSPRGYLLEQMNEAVAWPRIHAAEGLLSAGAETNAVAKTFRAELAKPAPDVPWRVGCLRVISQSGSAGERLAARRELGAIAVDPDNQGVTHAVETLMKLGAELTPEEREVIAGYAKADDLRSDYAIALLAGNGDAGARAELLRRLEAGNPTAAYSYYYLGGLSPQEIAKLREFVADPARPAAQRADVLRALAAQGGYNDAEHAEMVKMLAAGDSAALRSLFFTAGDFHRREDLGMLQRYFADKSLPLSTRITAAAALLRIEANR